MVSFTDRILRTRQAREAMGEGVSVFLTTGDLGRGFDAMIRYGKRNGAYGAFKFAVLLDIIASLVN